VPRIQPLRFSQPLDRIRQTVLLIGDEAREIPHIEMARRRRHQPAIEQSRLLQPARTVVRHGLLKLGLELGR
jgi:hypothetical protein